MDQVLTEEINYKYNNSLYIPVKKKEYKYTIEHSGTNIEAFGRYENNIYGMKLTQLSPEILNFRGQVHIGAQFDVFKYRYLSAWYHLDEIIETDYYSDDLKIAATSKKKIIYSSTCSYPSDNLFYNSDGSILHEKFKYPSDFAETNSNPIKHLVGNHITNTPLETQKWKDDVLVKASYTEFGFNESNTFVSPIKFYESECPSGMSNLAFSNQFSTLPFSNKYKEQITFKFNDFDNKVEQRIINDMVKTYLWSYNNTYPIAQIINADYATVINALENEAVIKDFATKNPTDEEVKTFTNKLRLASSLKNALITTFTYKPLIGMTSQTDPNGITTYFEYDDFGRLKYAKDKDMKVLKHYQYNYAK
jgi:YD repeat-containing protein